MKNESKTSDPSPPLGAVQEQRFTLTHLSPAGPDFADVTVELRGCPFCGGKPYAVYAVNGTQMFKIGCPSCGVELKAAWSRYTPAPTKDIVSLWNLRASARSAQEERIFEAVVHCYEGDEHLIPDDLKEASFVRRARKFRLKAESGSPSPVQPDLSLALRQRDALKDSLEEASAQVIALREELASLKAQQQTLRNAMQEAIEASLIEACTYAGKPIKLVDSQLLDKWIDQLTALGIDPSEKQG